MGTKYFAQRVDAQGVVEYIVIHSGGNKDLILGLNTLLFPCIGVERNKLDSKLQQDQITPNSRHK